MGTKRNANVPTPPGNARAACDFKGTSRRRSPAAWKVPDGCDQLAMLDRSTDPFSPISTAKYLVREVHLAARSDGRKGKSGNT